MLPLLVVGVGLTAAARPTGAQPGRPAVTGPPAADGIRLDIAARSMAPGELLVVTVGVERQTTAVRVSAFNRHTLATDLGDGRWQALVGIDLDQRPGRYTVAVDADGPAGMRRKTRPIVVEAKAFATRTLTVDPSFVAPTPAQMIRIEQDQAFLKGVFADATARRLWHDPFVRPVPGQANGRFGARSIFNGERRAPHGGTDLLSPAGTPVKAPNAGRVVCARDLYFTGQTVVLDHGLGVFSLLAHLSRLDVSEGDVVTAGQVVGLVGSTGRVTGPHLHWAVRVGGARVDPLSVLALVGVKTTSGG